MKTIYFLFLRAVPILIGICMGFYTAKAEFPPESESVELHTLSDPNTLGKFDGRGRLLYQELYQDGSPFEWQSTSVYYPRGSQKGVRLNRDISAINVFFAAEIYRPKTVRTFIEKYLTFFLRGYWGDDPIIITTRDVEIGTLGSDPRRYDPQFRRPETRRVRARMRPYARASGSSDPVVVGNGWTVDMNVLTNEGAVEHWLVKGQVRPFRIDSFLCETKEPQGSFKPYIRTR